MRQEDQVVVSIGYTDFVMPMKVGMALFNAMAGTDIYIREERYEKVNGEHQAVHYIRLLTPDKTPKLQHIGPAQFHVGLENQRMRDEQEAAKAAAKAADAQ